MLDEGISSRLDGSADPLARYYAGTAEEYDKYQRQAYSDHYKRFRSGWELHYGKMRTAILTALWRFTEKHKDRKDTTGAIVGPGFDVANRDLNSYVIEAGISQLRRIVVIDFSAAVIHDAVNSLMHAGVDPEKMPHLQYDFTGGLSTVYLQFLREKLKNVFREDELNRVVEEFEHIDIIGELQGRLVESLLGARTGEISSDVVLPDDTINDNRSLELHTTRGEPVPLDFVMLNMVIAGTGVPGEAIFWDVDQNVSHTTDTDRNAPPDDDLLDVRRWRREVVHEKIIAPFNENVAVATFDQILTANPGATVLAITDTATTYSDPELNTGSLLRLPINRVRTRLRDLGIDLRDSTSTSQWIWKEEEHSHPVHTLTATRMKSQQQRKEVVKPVVAPPPPTGNPASPATEKRENI